MYCQKCGRQNPDDAEFCGFCGASFRGALRDNSSVLQPGYCPECGRQNPDDAEFCGFCGAQMPVHTASVQTKYSQLTETSGHSQGSPPKKSKTGIAVGATIVIIAIIAFLIFVNWGDLNGDDFTNFGGNTWTVSEVMEWHVEDANWDYMDIQQEAVKYGPSGDADRDKHEYYWNKAANACADSVAELRAMDPANSQAAQVIDYLIGYWSTIEDGCDYLVDGYDEDSWEYEQAMDCFDEKHDIFLNLIDYLDSIGYEYEG